ncbi:MAG: hypothetical protein WAO52_08065 [Prolixibacteraceae bacterium]
MKTKKQFLVLILLILSGLLQAQNTFLPDEIWYDSGKNIYVQFSLPSVYDLDQYTEPSKIFEGIYTGNMQERMLEAEKNGKISVEQDGVKNENRIRIVDKFENLNPLPKELINESGTDFQELKIVTREGTKLNCYFRNTDELLAFLENGWQSDIVALNQLIKKESAGYKNKVVSLLYRKSGDEIQNVPVNWKANAKNLDQLQLTGSAGMNLFKSKFLPSFKFHLGLVFNQKGIYKNHYFAEYEIMYDFVTEDNQVNAKSGHFLDLGYMYNFGKSPEKADWYGVSAGYLIKGKSNLFDDHTWRISVYRNISKNIQLVPQIYFPKNFSGIFPGLNLNINF